MLCWAQHVFAIAFSPILPLSSSLSTLTTISESLTHAGNGCVVLETSESGWSFLVEAWSWWPHQQMWPSSPEETFWELVVAVSPISAVLVALQVLFSASQAELLDSLAQSSRKALCLLWLLEYAHWTNPDFQVGDERNRRILLWPLWPGWDRIGSNRASYCFEAKCVAGVLRAAVIHFGAHQDRDLARGSGRPARA